MMKRRHLIELHDCSWFPQSARNCVTHYLQFLMERFQPYRAVFPLLFQALEGSNKFVILDLCSGGGGPAFSLQQVLQERGLSYRVCLSDKYPNKAVWARLINESGGKIFTYNEPLDCLVNGEAPKGFRTMFTAAHHFVPAEARQILAQAISSENGIGIFEVTERSITACLRTIPICLFMFLAVPFLRPFSMRHIFWTYIAPLAPFSVLWDGVVSNLRTYNPQELRTLAEDAVAGRQPGATAFSWDSGVINSHFGARITYLIGTPCRG